MNVVVIKDLFVAFFVSGVTTFGGGPSLIPIIEEQVVDKHGWMSSEEYVDVLAFANALPGPIATKLAAVIGYKVFGIIGALTAIFAAVFPTALAIVLLMKFYLAHKEEKWVSGMMQGVRPVIIIVLFQMCFSMLGKVDININFIIIALISIVLLYFKVPITVIIITSLLVGAVFIR